MSTSTRPAWSWYTDLSRQFMERDYLLPNQSMVARVSHIAHYAQDILLRTAKPEFREHYTDYAERFLERMKKGWYSLSTPIWTNFGTARGLGISCYGSYIGDTSGSIIMADAEAGMLSKLGGGTSAYFDLRPLGAPITDNGFSNGPLGFVPKFEKTVEVFSQGNTRRGNFAGYLSVEHPDIMAWLQMREDGHPIQNISFGVCVPSHWLKAAREGDVQKQTVWAKILESRARRGYPYIFFDDNANVGFYKEKNLRIWASNLCTEIMEPASEDETFVCDLASMNMLYAEEWSEDPEALFLLTALLDAVMTDFIERASQIPFMQRAVNFAKRHRALGIGQIGWHSFLQSKMIPFESWEAKQLNLRYVQVRQLGAQQASVILGEHFGVPELMEGTGRRNAVLLADAPTTSSAFILGQVSQSFEPWTSNYFVKKLAKITVSIRNPHLDLLLQSLDKNTPEVWESILKRGGSVQHLDFLTDLQKEVFKTFAEISQKEIIIQAAQRQKYIDQGQSINLMIHPSISARDVNQLVLFAHDMGIKSLYYQHSVNAAQEFSRDILGCASCE